MKRLCVATLICGLIGMAFLLACGKAETPRTPQLIKAGEDTDGAGYLAYSLQQSKNLVWCATMPLAWNSLCDSVIKGPLLLEGSPTMQTELNKRESNETDLDQASYVAMAGFGRDGILEKIDAALENKFGSNEMRTPIDLAPDDILAYAYMLKTLRFQVAFEVEKEGLEWNHGAERGLKLRAFGLFSYSKSAKDIPIARQVFIHRYADDGYVVELFPKDPGDRIFLAAMTPKPTLKETLAEALSAVDGRSEEHPYLRQQDALRIPCLALNVEMQFPEIEKKIFQNKGFETYYIAKAYQRILFQLDETGAKVESEAKIKVWKCEEEETPKPRQLVFDRPFLAFLMRRDAKMPYFALWVGNPSILVRAK